MLMDFFRRHEKLVHWVLLPVIAIPFLLVFGGRGFNSLGQADGGSLEGEILNRAISSDEILEAAFRCFGPQGRDPLAQAMALDRLLVLTAAQQGGLRISEAEVDEALKRLLSGDPSLQIPGILSYNSFDGKALAQLGMDEEAGQRAASLGSLFLKLFRKRLADYAAGQLTKAEFRQLRECMREELVLKRHTALILDAAKVTTPQLFEQYLREHTRLRLQFVRAETKTFEPRIPPSEISDEALQAFFDARKDTDYQIPEILRLEFLLADRKQLQAQFPVDPADLEAAYTADPDRWKDPETKAVRTLDEARETLTEELSREKVLSRMDELVSSALDLPEGMPFEEVARRLPPLAASRAELKRNEAPQTEALGRVYDLHEAVKDLEPGQRSLRFLECENGACLLRLLGREAARSPELDQVRERTLKDLKAERAKALAGKALEDVRQKAAGGDLSAACASVAAEQGGAVLTYGELEPFADPRIDETVKPPPPADLHPGGIRAAFALKEAGELTEPDFSEDFAEGTVFRLAERLDPPPDAFLSARAGMADRTRQQMAHLLLNDWLRAVESRSRVKFNR